MLLSGFFEVDILSKAIMKKREAKLSDTNREIPGIGLRDARDDCVGELGVGHHVDTFMAGASCQLTWTSRLLLLGSAQHDGKLIRGCVV